MNEENIEGEEEGEQETKGKVDGELRKWKGDNGRVKERNTREGERERNR